MKNPNVALLLNDFYIYVKEKFYDFLKTIPRPKGPDFFIVGASRSGTTFLHHFLAQHPDIFMPQIKELHYFNKDKKYRESLLGYRSFFSGYKAESMFGEVTPFYFYANMLYDKNGDVRFDCSESAISRIHKHFPNAFIIVSLRDPFERLLSMYKKNFYQGKITTSLDQAIRDELDGKGFPTLLHRSRYDVHLGNILQHIPKSLVKILIFEEWTEAPKDILPQLYTFLNVTPLTHAHIPKIKNEAKEYDTQNLKSQTKQEPDINLTSEIRGEVERVMIDSKTYVEKLMEREMPWPLLNPAYKD